VRTLTTWWQGLVDEYGAAEALVEPEGHGISFAGLEGRVADLAGLLRAEGLGRGDRLASMVPNGILSFELALAAARLGAITIGVNTRYRAADLRHVLERGRPRLLVSTTDFLGLDFPATVADALVGLPHPPRVQWTTDIAARRSGAPPVLDDGAQPADLLVAFTTSGTTGLPKLAAHDHATTVRHLQAAARSLEVGPGATGLLVLPFCGTFGFVTSLSLLAGGARVVVPDRFDASAAAELVDRFGVTHLNGSDDMLLAVMGQGRPLSTWRHGVQAEFTGQGAAVTTRAQAGGARITGVYGSSETFALLARWSPDQPVAQRCRIGGVPADAATEVRAVDTTTGAVLTAGQVGELQFRGPSVLSGYLEDARTRPPDLLPGGWLRTGDLGFVDPDGGFVHLARMNDALRLAGFLVDPSEIEQHLLAHAGVTGAQVVGTVTTGGRQVAVAFVTADGEVGEPDLIAHCRAGLANYKVPVRIIALDAFPTVDGANGVKVRKEVLRQRAAELLPGR
jgi:fatty-acyl-CoA synthase